MAESPRQKRISGRVMHEFKHGELKSGGGEKVTSRRQAVAIALSEAGASNQAAPRRNARNLHRTERNEADGRTAQQEREGKSHIGADGKRESSPAMGGKDARKPARGRKPAASGATRQQLYARAQKKGVAGRSSMSKQQLETALGVK